MSADEALQRLKDGNERFLRGEAHGPWLQRETLAELARGQRPFATIRGCIDARVAEGRMKIVGAMYEIETGRVRFLDAMGPPEPER